MKFTRSWLLVHRLKTFFREHLSSQSNSSMLHTAATPPACQKQSAARPRPGFHPDSEAFAATLAEQKQAHARAAAEAAARLAQLQSRRENVHQARSIFNTVFGDATRQIESGEAARSALFICVERALRQAESLAAHSESFSESVSESFSASARCESSRTRAAANTRQLLSRL